MTKIISIKHNDTEFATLDNNSSIVLNCAGKIINDTISASINLQKYTGTLLTLPNKPTNLTPSATYDGNEHTNGYTCPNTVTMTGQDRGTDAGTYTANYTPKSGIIWSDGTLNTETVTLTISSTPTPEGATLNDCSWTNISAVADYGTAANYWSVGDTKTGTYINNESQSYRIVEFNHSGDAGHITFEQVNMLNIRCVMTEYKEEGYKLDSWANSDLKTTIDNFAIDSTLDAVIKTASKPCATSVSDGTQTSVSSKLWIMSEKEMFNTTTCSICTTEGSQYTYYANGGSKEKSGAIGIYWLRSATSCQPAAGSFFAFVYFDGTAVDYSLSYTLCSVAPCFCI